MPFSSIHTAIGMLLIPNSSAGRWRVSMTHGWVGFARSIHLYVCSGSTSRATLTTDTFSGSSSSWSACHEATPSRHPQ